MRLIDADALLENVRYHAKSAKEHGFANVYNGISIACGEIIDAPTIDAVPTSELHELKNEMYENDGITMGNIAKLNALMSKYANGEPVHGIRHGHWINGCYTAPIMPETDVCSECGLRLVYGLNFNYCPNCGAKMDEVSE